MSIQNHAVMNRNLDRRPARQRKFCVSGCQKVKILEKSCAARAMEPISADEKLDFGNGTTKIEDPVSSHMQKSIDLLTR